MTAMALLVGGVALVTTYSGVRTWWSSVGVLERLDVPTLRRPAPKVLQRAVERAAIDVEPRLLLDIWIGAAVVAGAATPVVAGAPVALAVVVLGPPAALVAARDRADRLRTAQVPLALDAIAGSLRGGAALSVAIAEAASIGGPLGRELGEVARRCRDGLDVRVAVEAWAVDPEPDTALAGASLTMAASVGGPAADALESAAVSLRQRASAGEEVAALSVQARLSAIVLSAAPVGFTFLLATVDPGSARFLLGTPAGWACIVLGVALDLVGAWWMHRLVRSAS